MANTIIIIIIYSIGGIREGTNECIWNENNNKSLDSYSFDKPFLYDNTLFFPGIHYIITTYTSRHVRM